MIILALLATMAALTIAILCGIANTIQIGKLRRRVHWLENPEPEDIADLRAILGTHVRQRP